MPGKKKAVIYGISFSLGVFLILWGYGNLFPIENMENRLVEQHLSNWYAAPILTRILIALQFIVGLLFILNINPRNILPRVFLGFMLLGMYDLALDAFNAVDMIALSYARMFGMGLGVSFLVYILGLVLAVVLVKLGKSTDLKFKWIKYPLGIILFSLPFILNPVYPSDLADQSIPVEEGFEFEGMDIWKGESTENTTILAFYSTSCPHCLNSMRRFAISRKQSEDYPPVFIGFLGSEEGIASFFKQARAESDYTILEAEAFFKMSGSTYPSFVLVENGIATTRWNGRTFNYHTLQHFAK